MTAHRLDPPRREVHEWQPQPHALDAYGFDWAPKTFHAGLRPKSVGLDSGDLVDLSRQVRRRLDQAGLTETRIFTSGDLDEFVIADLLARGAQIDTFGVGTALATSKDAHASRGPTAAQPRHA